MTKLVFLVEEPSMADLLDGLLPRLFPALRFQCVPHDGKQDLEKSIPRKLRAWREPGVRFVVTRDQDSADCRLPEFQKRLGARRMADHLSRESRSRSFQVFLEGVERLHHQNPGGVRP